jgi:hypothetical protein
MMAHRYVENLAACWGYGVNQDAFGDVWTVRDKSDHVPNIGELVYQLDLCLVCPRRGRLRSLLRGSETIINL